MRLFVFALLALLLTPQAHAADAPGLLVFAAASLTEALTEVGETYAKTGKPKPVFSFAASSALARQIENAAPAHMFISADEQWMDYLAERKLIVADTRSSFLGNSLVLIAPADRPFKIDIRQGFPLAKTLGAGKLAMGDPDSVPVGRYGKAALENLGVWKDVEANVVRGDSVRTALAFVERGEAAAGVVYATDAALTKKVSVVGAFPEGSYPPVSYPLAVLAGHDTPEARDFRTYLLGPEGAKIFQKYGFKTK